MFMVDAASHSGVGGDRAAAGGGGGGECQRVRACGQHGGADDHRSVYT